MLKFKILLFYLTVVVFPVFSQQLTPEEKAVFDDVVFSRVRIGEYEKIQKWVVPIRYKIYGDTSAYLVKDVDTVFSQLKRLTALDIKKSDDEDEVNIKIVFGSDPESFKSFTLSKMPLEEAGNYRKRANINNELYQAAVLLNTKKYNDRTIIKNAFRRMLLKTLGFPKTSALAPNSLFYSSGNGKIKIDAMDSHIISALYLPFIKPGLTKDEVDAIWISMPKKP